VYMTKNPETFQYQPFSEMRFTISRTINSFFPCSLAAVSRASAPSALLLKLF